jgi:hypothetical protein
VNWAQAFARQAASDLRARDVIIGDKTLPQCHSLHYLQMACEKICKASMIAGGVNPNDLQTSHAYIAKQLPNIVHVYLGRDGRGTSSWVVDAIRPLARKIELLNPAVRDGGRSPQNCEYPWAKADGSVVAPADYKFEFREMFEPAGVMLLKIIRQLAEELQK